MFTIVIMVRNAHVMAMPVRDQQQLLEQLGKLLFALGAARELINTCAAPRAFRRQSIRENRSTPPATIGHASPRPVKTGIPGRLRANVVLLRVRNVSTRFFIVQQFSVSIRFLQETQKQKGSNAHNQRKLYFPS